MSKKPTCTSNQALLRFIFLLGIGVHVGLMVGAQPSESPGFNLKTLDPWFPPLSMAAENQNKQPNSSFSRQEKTRVLKSAKRFEDLFIYYGSPGKLTQKQWKTLATKGSLILTVTGDPQRSGWKKKDLMKLRELGRRSGNQNPLVLSYLSVGGADKIDKRQFESQVLPLLKTSWPGKTEKQLMEMIWVNASEFNEANENTNDRYIGALINLQTPGLFPLWQKFREKALASALQENPEGGVFFDDSDVAQLYLDRFWKKKKEDFLPVPENETARKDSLAAEMSQWMHAFHDFSRLYMTLAIQAARSSPGKSVIVQNRGLSLRDPYAYEQFNPTTHAWENDAKRHFEVTAMLNRVNSATVFENMKSRHQDYWFQKLVQALQERRPIIVVNFEKLSMPQTTLQSLIQKACIKTRDDLFTADDLKSLVSIRYYATQDFQTIP